MRQLAPIKRIALFMPRTNSFYLSLFFSLKRAFNTLDIEVCGWTTLLGENDLLAFVRQFKPDAILEMNRSRRQTPSLPPEIKHISWMVDVADWSYENISESEIIYFFGHNWFKQYPRTTKNIVGWLPPGACPETYFFNKNISAVSDISFIGHIPQPWSEKELNRVIGKKRQGVITFRHLYKACLQQWKTSNLKNYDNELYLDSAQKIASNLCDTQIKLNNQKIRYDISCRAVRTMNRQKLVKLALSISSSLRIFGPDYWQLYPEFSNNYQKFLHDPEEIRQIYQNSTINLHEGVGLHFRTFDCLAAGGLLFYLQGPDDDDSGGINNFFEPNKHYISFNENNLAEKASRYLTDKNIAKSICEKASKLVHAKHTWKHRAIRILTDLNEC